MCFLILDRIYGIIVAGGRESSTVDFISGDLGIKQLANLPQSIRVSSMVAHNGKILLCGGWWRKSVNVKCLQLDHNTWKEHSTINRERAWHSAVTTQAATFVFGGYYTSKTYEYLPIDSTEWIKGRTEIPGGFAKGFAIAVKSEQEIWLIGGWRTEKRILSFDVNDHTFKILPFQLNVGRRGHSCALIPNTNQIMITGGDSDGFQDSTEALNTQDGSVTMASLMNSKRFAHGMGVVTINGENRVAVFGGHDGKNELDSIEFYDTHTEKWEMTEFKLSEAKYGFGFLTLKLGDILSQL